MDDGAQPFSRRFPEIAGFEIEDVIGQGGFATVYRARQPSLGRLVAIKVIHTGGQRDEAALRRFQRESQLTGTLTGQPHVVTVFEAGVTAEGDPFMALEYLPQGSLQDQLDSSGPLSSAEVTKVGLAVLDALVAATAVGIVHRDIKPANILRSGTNEYKLGDFGIAGLRDGSATATSSTSTTVAFAAPEVIHGDRASTASDLYSLGATLYALLTGSPAFSKDTDQSVIPMLMRITTDPFPPLPERAAPEGLRTLITDLTRRDPADRPSDMATLVGRLGGATPPAPPTPPPPPPAFGPPPTPTPPLTPPPVPPPVPPPAAESSRRGLLGAVAVVILLALMAGAAVLLLSRDSDGETAVETDTGTATTGASEATSDPAGFTAYETAWKTDLGALGTDVAVVDGTSWVTANAGTPEAPVGQLIAINAGGEVTSTIAMEKLPGPITAAGSTLWMSTGKDGTIVAMNGETGEQLSSRTFGEWMSDLYVDTERMWLTGYQTGALTTVAVDGESVVGTPERVPVCKALQSVTVGFDSVWVTCPNDGAVARIDPETYDVTLVSTGGRPVAITAAFDKIWVTDYEHRVIAIDPTRLEVAATITTEGNPWWIASDSEIVWVSESKGKGVFGVDGRTLKVLRGDIQSTEVGGVSPASAGKAVIVDRQNRQLTKVALKP